MLRTNTDTLGIITEQIKFITMKKLLKSALFSSLVAAGSFGAVNGASAAIFSEDSLNQLSFNVIYDIENLQYERVTGFSSIPDNPDNPFDLVAKGLDLLPGGGPGVRTTDAPNIEFLPGSPTAELSIAGTGNLSGGLDGFEICNTGTLNSTNCTPAEIRDFTLDSSVGSNPLLTDPANIVSSFITIQGSDDALGLAYDLTLDKNTIDTAIPGDSIIQFTGTGDEGQLCSFNPGQEGCDALVDFAAKGKLTVTGLPDDTTMFPDFDMVSVGDTFHVEYFYSGTGLFVDGANSTSCGPNNGDMCNIEFQSTSGSGNLRVVIKDVPEPGTILGLLAVGGLGLGLKRKQVKK